MTLWVFNAPALTFYADFGFAPDAGARTIETMGAVAERFVLVSPVTSRR